ncbi:hypothetical protein BGX28_006114 [Mortierella sp. GBA30]|nr:hypothetical protein BGX28_006114 [Mortierella sp. GBA30]
MTRRTTSTASSKTSAVSRSSSTADNPEKDIVEYLKVRKADNDNHESDGSNGSESRGQHLAIEDYGYIVHYLEDDTNWLNLFGEAKKTTVGKRYMTSMKAWELFADWFNEETVAFKFNVNGRSVQQRVGRYKKKYQKARKLDGKQTGGGLEVEDSEETLTAKRESICPHYERMNDLYGSSPMIEPQVEIDSRIQGIKFKSRSLDLERSIEQSESALYDHSCRDGTLLDDHGINEMIQDDSDYVYVGDDAYGDDKVEAREEEAEEDEEALKDPRKHRMTAQRQPESRTWRTEEGQMVNQQLIEDQMAQRISQERSNDRIWTESRSRPESISTTQTRQRSVPSECRSSEIPSDIRKARPPVVAPAPSVSKGTSFPAAYASIYTYKVGVETQAKLELGDIELKKKKVESETEIKKKQVEAETEIKKKQMESDTELMKKKMDAETEIKMKKIELVKTCVERGLTSEQMEKVLQAAGVSD